MWLVFLVYLKIQLLPVLAKFLQLFVMLRKKCLFGGFLVLKVGGLLRSVLLFLSHRSFFYKLSIGLNFGKKKLVGKRRKSFLLPTALNQPPTLPPNPYQITTSCAFLPIRVLTNKKRFYYINLDFFSSRATSLPLREPRS